MATVGERRAPERRRREWRKRKKRGNGKKTHRRLVVAVRNSQSHVLHTHTHTLYLLHLHTHTHTHAHAHTQAHTHTHTHARTRTHTQPWPSDSQQAAGSRDVTTQQPSPTPPLRPSSPDPLPLFATAAVPLREIPRCGRLPDLASLSAGKGASVALEGPLSEGDISNVRVSIFGRALSLSPSLSPLLCRLFSSLLPSAGRRPSSSHPSLYPAETRPSENVLQQYNGVQECLKSGAPGHPPSLKCLRHPPAPL